MMTSKSEMNQKYNEMMAGLFNVVLEADPNGTTGKVVLIALSYRQAEEAFSTLDPDVVLCVKVPEAAYCLSCKEAEDFFKGIRYRGKWSPAFM